uniref:[histone H3]-lysine(36) N-trimethyltransferase n=1 Tax=Psoroptes ovis TaxID=83912 RepID=A0A3B0QQA6_PSOOV|nr:histone-lysineN-methyltransferase SETD2-like [Psoroptes ovis]
MKDYANDNNSQESVSSSGSSPSSSLMNGNVSASMINGTSETTSIDAHNNHNNLNNPDSSYDINFVATEIDVCASNVEIVAQENTVNDDKSTDNTTQENKIKTPGRRGRKPKKLIDSESGNSVKTTVNNKKSSTKTTKKTPTTNKRKEKLDKKSKKQKKSSKTSDKSKSTTSKKSKTKKRRSTRIKNLSRKNSDDKDDQNNNKNDDSQQESQQNQQMNGHLDPDLDGKNDHSSIESPTKQPNDDSKSKKVKHKSKNSSKKVGKSKESKSKHHKSKHKSSSSSSTNNVENDDQNNPDNSSSKDNPSSSSTTALPQSNTQEPNDNDSSSVTLMTNNDAQTKNSNDDNNKSQQQQQQQPEKVKSRWRRNSELDTVDITGNGTASTTTTTPSSLSSSTESMPLIPIQNNENCTQSSTDQNDNNNNNNGDCLNDGEQFDLSELPSYEDIDENIFLFEKKKCKTKKETKKMVCDCILMKDERLRGQKGCGDDCLNRMLMIECGSRCPLEDHCSNKRFQRKEYRKLAPFKTKKKGWGLKALEPIPADTFLMEYVGEVIDPYMFHKRTDKYSKQKLEHYYFMALKSDEIIDATAKGNITRFINHSCEPNSMTQKWTVNGELRIGFFTIRSIEAGEEITFDYQFQRYGKKAQKCFCESKSCRGFIGSSESGREILTDGTKIPKKSRKKIVKEPKKKIDEEEENDEQKQEQEESEDDDEESLDKSSDDDESDKEAFLEDVAHEIDLLAENGLRNRQQILEVSRLMLRVDKSSQRIQLIDIIMSTTELAFLRLFIDYHGLRIIWGWMIEAETVDLKARLLELLEVLPITNRTIIQDCKVLEVVERWAAVDSPEWQQHLNIDVEEVKNESNDNNDSTNNEIDNQSSQTSSSNVVNIKKELNDDSPKPKTKTDLSKLSGKIVIKSKTKSDTTTASSTVNQQEKTKVTIGFLAQKLLNSWKDLKEIFRIPRLEREKRRDDEAEADRKTKEEEERRSNGSSYIHNNDKRSFDDSQDDDGYNNTISGILGNKRRCIKNLTNRRTTLMMRSQQQQFRNDSNTNPPTFHLNSVNQNSSSPKLSKEEARKQFVMNLVQDDYAKALNEYNEQMKLYRESIANRTNEIASMMSNPELIQQYLAATLQQTSNQMLLPPFPLQNHNIINAESVENQLLYQIPPQQPIDYLISDTTQIQPPLQDLSYEQLPYDSYDDANYEEIYELKDLMPKYESPLIQLVGSNDNNGTNNNQSTLNNKSSYDSQQYTYDNIPPEAIDNVDFNQIKFEDDNCFESMEKRMFDEIYPQPGIFFITKDSKTYYFPIPNDLSDGAINVKENITEPLPISFTKTLPDQKNLSYDWKSASHNGHYYYYNHRKQIKQWHPPQDNQIDNYYGDINNFNTDIDMNLNNISTIGGTTEMPADEIKRTKESSKRTREHFRYKISQFIVKCLNPYMRSSCTKGRIVNSNDFKNLARKVSHFNFSQLKQVKSSKDLHFSDSVKHKTKDFIKRHMSQFCPVYKPESSSSSSYSRLSTNCLDTSQSDISPSIQSQQTAATNSSPLYDG